jgi:hypothetical protein
MWLLLLARAAAILIANRTRAFDGAGFSACSVTGFWACATKKIIKISVQAASTYNRSSFLQLK